MNTHKHVYAITKTHSKKQRHRSILTNGEAGPFCASGGMGSNLPLSRLELELLLLLLDFPLKFE